MCLPECFSHLTPAYPITPDGHQFGCFLLDSHTIKFLFFFLFIFNKILARCSEGGAQSNAVKAETPFPPSVSLLLVGFEI